MPVYAWGQGASKAEWPLGMGYARLYGFIGGETNQWYPDLAEDNHYIDQPYRPEDGYHLSKDLADKALEFIRDSKQSDPDDSGDAVSSAYDGDRFDYTGGSIRKVVFDVADDQYIDVERQLAALLARD